MIGVMFAAALLFWSRDFLLLRIGPPRRLRRRVWMYGAIFFLMAALFGALTWSFGSSKLAALIRSPFILASLVAFHVAAGVACFGLKQTERYDIAWLMAIIPAPGFWFLLAQATFLPAYGWGVFAMSLIVALVSAVWAVMMIVTVLKMRRAQMPVEDMDFAIRLAAWTNCLAIGLVSVTI
jgi:hypothetical protein